MSKNKEPVKAKKVAPDERFRVCVFEKHETDAQGRLRVPRRLPIVGQSSNF
jgi:hypothetical protein